MEYQQTQRQRLQAFQRLERLKRSTRPEKVLPLFTFEDYEEAVKRCKVFEEEQKRIREERLKREKEMAEAAVRAEVDKEKERVDGQAAGVRPMDDADDEDDDVGFDGDESNLQQPCGIRTPDRPIVRRREYGNSKADEFGSGSGSGSEFTPGMFKWKKTPLTAENKAYATSEDGGSSCTSYSTAATTPENGNEPIRGQTQYIYDTPTKQPHRRATNTRTDDTGRKSNERASKPAYISRPIPRRGDFATVRATDEPIEDWFFLVRACLQCEIAGVKCGMQIPACTQCQRRFNGNVRGYQTANNSNGSGSGSSNCGSGMYGLGDWSRPDGIFGNGGGDASSQCLVQRRWHCREITAVRALPDRREAVLIRLESDGDDVWEAKLHEAAKLLDVYRTRQERRNWALPSQASRIAGYPAPKTVAENDRLLERRLIGAIDKHSQPNEDHYNEQASSFGVEHDNIISIDSLNGHLRRVRLNISRRREYENKRGSGKESGSDDEHWWEEHLTNAERRRRRKERLMERERQRRSRESCRRRQQQKKKHGVGPKSKFDSSDSSDASVDSFGAGSVHLG